MHVAIEVRAGDLKEGGLSEITRDIMVFMAVSSIGAW